MYGGTLLLDICHFKRLRKYNSEDSRKNRGFVLLTCLEIIILSSTSIAVTVKKVYPSHF